MKAVLRPARESGVPVGDRRITGALGQRVVDHAHVSRRVAAQVEHIGFDIARIDAMPGLAFVKAGTLNDTSWLKPTVEVWCRSAQPWVAALPGSERYDGDIPS